MNYSVLPKFFISTPIMKILILKWVIPIMHDLLTMIMIAHQQKNFYQLCIWSTDYFIKKKLHVNNCFTLKTILLYNFSNLLIFKVSVHFVDNLMTFSIIKVFQFSNVVAVHSHVPFNGRLT